MEISEREKHIKVLEKLLKETKGRIELYSENKDIDLTKEKEIVETLAYAISSLKTDLKYDLMYEGEDVYTKADMLAMLTELRTEINIMSDSVVEGRTVTITSWGGMKKRICMLIQARIDKLKENEDG